MFYSLHRKEGIYIMTNAISDWVDYDYSILNVFYLMLLWIRTIKTTKYKHSFAKVETIS